MAIKPFYEFLGNRRYIRLQDIGCVQLIKQAQGFTLGWHIVTQLLTG